VAKHIVVIVIMVAVLGVPVSAVDVGTEPGGRIATEWVGREAVLDVRYVHSVERTPVEEVYRVGRSGITLESMKWQSTGAGLPDSYDTWENGFYGSEPGTPLGRRLSYWFLPVNQPEVRLNGSVLIRGYEEPTLLTVRVRTLPLGLLLARRMRG
jgi:hypothetical protein